LATHQTRIVYVVHKPFTQAVPVINNLQTSYKESSPNPVPVRNNSIIRTWLFHPYEKHN